MAPGNKRVYTAAQKAAYAKRMADRKSANSDAVAQPKRKYVRKSNAKKPGILSTAGSVAGGGLGSQFGPLGTAVGSF